MSEFSNFNEINDAPVTKEDKSMTWGIVAIITTFVCGFPVSLVFAIIAIINANKAKLGGYAADNNSTAKMLGIISLIVTIVLFVVSIILLIIFLPMYLEWLDDLIY